MVLLTVNLERQDISIEDRECRNWKQVDMDALFNDCNLEAITSNDVQELVTQMEKTMTQAVEKHAPLKKKKIVNRKKYPWFTLDVKSQRRIVRKCERRHNKCRLSSTWETLQVEKRKYKKLLYKSKITTTSDKIKKCGNNMKELYRLTSELTGTLKKNLMPP